MSCNQPRNQSLMRNQHNALTCWKHSPVAVIIWPREHSGATGKVTGSLHADLTRTCLHMSARNCTPSILIEEALIVSRVTCPTILLRTRVTLYMRYTQMCSSIGQAASLDEARIIWWLSAGFQLDWRYLVTSHRRRNQKA